MPCYIQIRDLHGIHRTYANFTVTKELKDTTRTLHSSRRHSSFTAKYELLRFWTNTCQVADNLTQSTLDLECLRFAHNLKQMVKSGDSQHSDFSSNVFPEESPLQITAGAFPLTKPPETPVLHPASRSWSPRIVTVTHSDAGQQGQHMRDLTSSNLDNPSFWKERCGHSTQHLSNSERNQAVSFCLPKLKYKSPLKESQSNISLIHSKYAELNKVVMNRSQVISKIKSPVCFLEKPRLNRCIHPCQEGQPPMKTWLQTCAPVCMPSWRVWSERLVNGPSCSTSWRQKTSHS